MAGGHGLTETAGPLSNTFRYFTLLEQGSAGWQVTAAQSTREAAFSPRVPPSGVGALAGFAGEYRTPRGTLLRVLAGEAALVLLEPSGKRLPMEPIGLSLFEFKELSLGNGVVRFVFTRGRDGRITGLSRLINGQVVSFPRVQSP